MTGIITSLPPPIEPPTSNTSGNPEVLGPLSYVPAVPNLTQTWTAAQTFQAGTIILQGTGGSSQVLRQSTLNGPVTVSQLSFSDISGSIGPIQLPTPTPSTLGGIFSSAAVSHQFLTQIGTDGTISAAQPSVSDISGGAALTRTNDTNVTLTLGGTPATALLAATSVTVGWTGTLAANRGGFGADVSAQSGVPLFATGVPTFTSTTGSGNFVRATSPTLVTPALGTPASGTLTNCTGLPLSGLATEASYTLVGNVTGSTASPTAFTIDGLTLKGTPASTDEVIIWDVAGAAIKKATVSGIGSSSGVSSIAGNTGAFTLSNGITNSTNDIRLNVGHLPGEPSNGSAASGEIGEIITASLSFPGAGTLTTGTATNVTSISLTAGDWDVNGTVALSGAGTLTQAYSAISTTSATIGSLTNSGNGGIALYSLPFSGGGSNLLPSGTVRISLSATTTVYLVTQGNLTGTINYAGFIRARRAR